MSEDDVRAFEAELGAPLPAEYRRFLLEHNGGYPTEGAVWLQTELAKTGRGRRVAVGFDEFVAQLGVDEE